MPRGGSTAVVAAKQETPAADDADRSPCYGRGVELPVAIGIAVGVAVSIAAFLFLLVGVSLPV